ncbi:MAG: MgtC/SapB family protein [Bacilli bacterium]|jgi:putative Mg2+ transporter-C (MgtC) family protein
MFDILATIVDPISQSIGDWFAEINIWTIIIRISLSVILAACLGMERSSKRHAAGLRTFILVALASTVGSMLDMFFIEKVGSVIPVISASVVIGVALISSNTILYSSKSQIKGLTTCVGLWSSAIIGIAFGVGFYTAGLISFALLMIILSILPKFERYLKNRSNHFEIHLELKTKNNLQDFVGVIRQLGLTIDDIEANPAYFNSGLSVYTISLSIYSKELKKYKTHTDIIKALDSLSYVNFIEEIN